MFLNASLNFCLYCLVSKRYRGLLRESIRKLFKKEKEWWCTSTGGGIQLRTRMSSLLSPQQSTAALLPFHRDSVPTTELEEHLTRERRASAPPLQT